MIRKLRGLWGFLRDRRGNAAVEFAFVAPIVLGLTVGTIDVGRLVWSASVLDHMAREATRYASVRGSESAAPVSESDLESYVHNRVIGMNPNDVVVTVTWSPSNASGSTVAVQLDYQFTFFLSGLVGLDPIQLQGDSVMVVL